MAFVESGVIMTREVDAPSSRARHRLAYACDNKRNDRLYERASGLCRNKNRTNALPLAC